MYKNIFVSIFWPDFLNGDGFPQRGLVTLTTVKIYVVSLGVSFERFFLLNNLKIISNYGLTDPPVGKS